MSWLDLGIVTGCLEAFQKGRFPHLWGVIYVFFLICKILSLVYISHVFYTWFFSPFLEQVAISDCSTLLGLWCVHVFGLPSGNNPILGTSCKALLVHCKQARLTESSCQPSRHRAFGSREQFLAQQCFKSRSVSIKHLYSTPHIAAVSKMLQTAVQFVDGCFGNWHHKAQKVCTVETHCSECCNYHFSAHLRVPPSFPLAPRMCRSTSVSLWWGRWLIHLVA